MNDFLQRITQLSPKRLALLALDLQQQLEAAQRGSVEPIAIVGLGCRLPGGANGPDGYWDLLREGRDAIREVPRERWDVDAWYDPDPDVPGKMATRWGGFLEGIDRFDPQFFGISPREAASMDPQQRLLLEVAWEALEHAGQAPDGLAESRTGVFVGICGNDYFQMLMASAAGPSNTYLATGTAHSILSGRLSYVLGLQGPSVTIDTACSSSLVAVHLACQSLRAGDCRMALAGGVNAVLLPEPTVALSTAHMMAPDGRCKAFDASANGFVRAEGCGVVVLKRLADARADGDRVLAVVAGSAVNQDGRSSGLTAPNGPSQEAVIREALTRAGIAPTDVSYVEAHGTGTSLGDPIEARALAAVLGQGRRADRPLTIGSVKTNVGHTEAAAGIAGLIKVVLSLRHGQIPAHLHLRTLSPHLPWKDLPLQVSSSGLPWPADERRFAGVSSFGFSGTNAHVIVADPPAARSDDEHGVERPLHVCCVSAKSATALRSQVQRFADHLKTSPDQAMPDVGYTANAGRAHFGHRVAVVAASKEELERELTDVLRGEDSPRARSAVLTSADEPEVAFLFAGQGAQYPGMASELYATQPVFRDALDRCAAVLEHEMDVPLMALLHGSATGRLNDTVYTQPATFALQYALAELWRAWGVKPAYVVGHSLGEFAAACVAGVIGLEDGLKLVAARGRLTGGLPPGGAMAAVEANAEQVERALRPYGSRVVVAAINGPSGHVLSGEAAAVEEVRAAFAAAGTRTQRLAVSHAFHSPLLEPALDAFEAIAAGIHFGAPQVGYISNVTGRLAGGAEVDAAYWRRHAREPVQFAAGMQTLWAQGCRLFVEIGPSTTLLGMARLCVPDVPEAAWLPSLRNGRADWEQLLETVADLYVRGVRVDWIGFDRAYRRRPVSLPTYPFERQRYWVEDAEIARRSTAAARVEPSSGGHPLLGRRTASARGEIIFETSVGVDRLPYLADHRVHDMLMLPASIALEMALAAAADVLAADRPLVEEATIHGPLQVPEEGDRALQIIVTRTPESGASFEIFGADEDAPSRWRLHASGRVAAAGAQAGGHILDVARARCAEEVTAAAHYQSFQAVGIAFGPAFQGIERLWRRDGEVVGRIIAPAGLSTSDYRLHPAVLDACFQLLGAGLPREAVHGSEPPTYLMVGIDRYVVPRKCPRSFWVHAVLHGVEHLGETLTGDVTLIDDEGDVLAALSGLRLQRARPRALANKGPSDKWLYEIRWQPAEALDADAATSTLAVSEVAAAIDAQAGPLAIEHDLATYQQLVGQLEALSATYVVRALAALGWEPEPGDVVAEHDLAQHLGVIPRHSRLFHRLLAILAEEDLLAAADNGWIVVRRLAASESALLPAAIRAKFPTFDAEVRLLERCGAALASVLRGERDPVQLLFPEGSLADVEKLTEGSPAARAYNALVQRAIAAAVAASGDRPLRCLEIGAGTGGTTTSVLRELPADRTEYVFTDISPLFLTRAEQKFAAHSFLSYRTLDIERPPQEQGFDAHRYDLVVAANVLHATTDVARALTHARDLLAPGGLLILLEGTALQRWVDLTFGLTDGWWKFADVALRPSHPLLSRDGWCGVLASAGFAGADALPHVPGGDDRFSRQAVVVARRPPDVPRSADAGDWLIVGDGHGLADALEAALIRRGVAAVRATPADQVTVLGDRRYGFDPARRADVEWLITALAQRTTPISRVVHLMALDAEPGEPQDVDQLDQDVDRSLHSGLNLVQAIVKAEFRTKPRVWMVTRNTQPVVDGASRGLALGQVPAWGLGRTAAVEHPEIWGGLIDVDERDPEALARLLVPEIAGNGREDQVALHEGRRYVARLVRSPRPPVSGSIEVHPDATYLVAGGTGGMGIRVAQWLVDRGARHLVLTGRTGARRMGADDRQALERSGAEVIVKEADSASVDDVARVLAEIGQDLPPLRGIIHVAGTFDDRVLLRHDWDRFKSVLAPKVRGGFILHHLTRETALDFFVLFSSGASFLAPVGLGNYAAGNAFLDGLAHHRRRLGLKALSINWGPWEKTGMAEAVGDRRESQWTQAGFSTMTPDQGLDVMERLVAGAPPQVAVLIVDWPKYVERFGTDTCPALYADLVREPRGAIRPTAAVPAGPTLAHAFDGIPPSERWDRLLEHVAADVAHVLGFPRGFVVDLEQGLFDLGMDSLTAVELKNRLQLGAGRTLPSTLAFDYPSVTELSIYLAREVLGWNEPIASNGAGAAMAGDVDDTDDYSEDELAAILSQKLQQLR